MGVIKSKMGTIGSKMGRKFEQKRKAKWVKEKSKFGQGLIILLSMCMHNLFACLPAGTIQVSSIPEVIGDRVAYIW